MWLAPLCLIFAVINCDIFTHQIIKMSERPLQYNQAREISLAINKWSIERNIDPYLVAAIMKVESNFGKYIKSKSGKDHGPMQINEWWFKKFNIKKKNVLTIDGSLKWGTKILLIAKEEYNKRNGGCWWSLYNSRNNKARKRYEMKIKKVFDSLEMEPNCISVNVSNKKSILFSATETRLLF